MFAWQRYRRIFARIAVREQRLQSLPRVVRGEDPSSRERVEFGSREFLDGKGAAYRLAYRRRILPLLLSAGREALRSLAEAHEAAGAEQSAVGARPPAVGQLPGLVRAEAPAGLFRELERFAVRQGVAAVGYAAVDPTHLFRGQAVLYPQAIVLVREMEADKLSRAPSFETLEMIHRSYLELGRAANRIAAFLRARGYGAQAGPSLGGAAIYPLLAERAGLGVIGMHGLLITPRFGSRQRLSVVYTSIRNLPYGHTSGTPRPGDAEWVRGFCQACRACASLCPGQAILPRPVEMPGGGLRHIDYRRCLPHFYALDGCSWCIRECPFGRVPYDVLRDDYRRQRIRLYREAGAP